MNYREQKAWQRQHCKPIKTHSESIAGWILAIAMAIGFALAIIEWGLS